MTRILGMLLGAILATIRLGPAAAENPEPAPEALAGTWVGQMSYNGETERLVLDLVNADGKLQSSLSYPVLHIWNLPAGPATSGNGELTIPGLGATLVYDRTAETLSATLPSDFVPVHPMRIVFHKSPAVTAPPRPDPDARIATPVWTFDAGSPVWADAICAKGLVIVGADDGQLHALDGRTGKSVWTFQTTRSIRARPAYADGSVFFQADDGFLYRLDAVTGKELWRARVCAQPIDRLELGDLKSRYENFASAAALDSGRLYLGTHDGHVLALDPASGSKIWDFAAADAVTSTPLPASGRVFFGSFDGNVYALDAGGGKLVWKYDTGQAVTTAAAIFEDKVIIGSRSYDLFALDAASGKPVWTQYDWFSWVESPAKVFDGKVYIGSSDAAKLYAIDARTGRRLWQVDALGSAWCEPAVTEGRVYVGAVGTVNYMVPHRATILAVDRKTGRAAWRYPASAPAVTPKGPRDIISYGFAGSPALGDGLVYFPSLDGHVYAFAQ